MKSVALLLILCASIVAQTPECAPCSREQLRAAMEEARAAAAEARSEAKKLRQETERQRALLNTSQQEMAAGKKNEATLSTLHAQAQERINGFQTALAERDRAIASLIAERDQALTERDTAICERDALAVKIRNANGRFAAEVLHVGRIGAH